MKRFLITLLILLIPVFSSAQVVFKQNQIIASSTPSFGVIVGSGVGTSTLRASSTPVFASFFATSTIATSTISGGLKITGGGLRINNLANCNLDTDGDGIVTCGTDATGGGGGGTGWASTTDAFSIYFTGRDYVGIGTTSPYAKLSVVGQAVAAYFTATTTSTSTLPRLNATGIDADTWFELGSNGAFTSLLGAGLQNTAGALTLNATGDWTGTIDLNNFAGGAIGAGELIYGGSAGSFSELAVSTNGFVLALSEGIPAWVATTTLSTISGTLAVLNGGTGQTTFTSSQLLYGNGTNALSSVATTSITCTGLLSCTGFNALGAASSINLAAANANTVLVNGTGASAVPTFQATSTFGTNLFGNGTAGQVLAWQGSAPIWASTSTCAAITGSADLCDGSDATGGGGGGTGWASTTDAFSIYFTGRDYVGIGTSTPSARLSVQQLNTTTLGTYIAGYSNATADILRVSTSTLTATTTAFVIDSQGRVGVGLTAPTAQLEVVGIASSTSLTVSSLNAASCDVKSTNGVFSCGTDASGSSASLGWASTTDAFSIYFNGRDYVGIGTTSPYAPLSVVGSRGIVTGKIHATSTTDTSTFDTPPTFSTLTSALIITGSGGLTAEYAGAAACTNQFVTAISVLGATTCASVNNAQWSGADLSVANGGTGLSTFGGSNTILYTTAADTLASEAAFLYNSSTNKLTVDYASTTALTVTGGTYLATGGGNSIFVGIGTTTPAWILQVASTSPMITLTDTNAGTDDKHGSFSYIDGIFRISTSSDALTSSTTALSINPKRAPSLSIGSTTQTVSAVNGLITQGSNGANGSSTISTGKLQFDSYDSLGARSCVFFTATSWVIQTGACNP